MASPPSPTITTSAVARLQDTSPEGSSWHRRLIVKTNGDGKTSRTESYEARYISTSEIAAAQDSKLRSQPSYRFREGTPGSLTAMIRASSGDRISPEFVSDQNQKNDPEDSTFTAYDETSEIQLEVSNATCGNLSQAESALQPHEHSRRPSNEENKKKRGRPPLPKNRRSTPTFSSSSFPYPADRKSRTSASVRLASSTPPIGTGASEQTDGNVDHRSDPLGAADNLSSLGKKAQDSSSAERRDSALASIETSSPPSDESLEMSNSAFLIQEAATPYSHQSRKTSRALAKLAIAGTSQLSSTGLEGPTKELWYKYKNKLFKYQGNEPESWVQEGPHEKEYFTGGTTRSTPARGSTSASASGQRLRV